MFEEATATLSPMVRDEAMCPDLSKSQFTFTYEDASGLPVSLPVKIKPLYVVNQKKFARCIAAFIDNVAYDLENQQWVNAVADSIRSAEVVPELIMILVENDRHEVTDQMRNYCTMQPSDMIKALRSFAEKNTEVGGSILSFFDSVWPRIKLNASIAVEKLKEQIVAAVDLLEEKVTAEEMTEPAPSQALEPSI